MTSIKEVDRQPWELIEESAGDENTVLPVEIHGRLDVKRMGMRNIAVEEILTIPYYQVERLPTEGEYETIDDIIEILRKLKSVAVVDWPGLSEEEAREQAKRDLDRSIAYLNGLQEIGYRLAYCGNCIPKLDAEMFVLRREGGHTRCDECGALTDHMISEDSIRLRCTECET